jgi:DNA-binding response OmpR family regulator
MDVNRILVVEDNFALNQSICDVLCEAGHDIKAVYCGDAAFEAVNRYKHLIALLTDIDLGPGPDGVDVARYARAFSPHLPVVFMSAAMDPRHQFNGIDRSECVTKPFLPQQVADALARVIRLEAS